MIVTEKQLSLKPQDLVVAVKLATNRNKEFVLTSLADELDMAVSSVHGSIKRCELARLVSRSAGSVRAIRASLKEFLLYGAKYAFPAILGPTGRGTPTSVGAPSLQSYFDQNKLPPPVWPDPEGKDYGTTVIPLHPTVPSASMKDAAFYELMALFDAIRLGAAREREIAANEISRLLS